MTRNNLEQLTPVLLTLALIAWTPLVYKHSMHGSWQVYPALAILPLALICHFALIIWKRPKWLLVLYLLIHMVVLVPIWIACFMLITKDSF